MTPTKPALLVGLFAALVMASGCGSSAPEPGDKKEDWKKTAPPPGWVGPGQPTGGATGGSPAPPGGHMEPPAGQ